jgi:hypothetical protein
MRPFHFQRSGTPNESVFPDVEVIPHHTHPPCFVTTEKILLGEVGIDSCCRAMYHNQSYTPFHPIHADMPNAPAIAEATAMITFKTISHVAFFFFCSSFIMLQTF